jgi:hypothetical protein
MAPDAYALAGAFYMRLVGRPLEVYQYLEPLYNDYRKVCLVLQRLVVIIYPYGMCVQHVYS